MAKSSDLQPLGVRLATSVAGARLQKDTAASFLNLCARGVAFHFDKDLVNPGQREQETDESTLRQEVSRACHFRQICFATLTVKCNVKSAAVAFEPLGCNHAGVQILRSYPSP